jgi:hypothetical protein
MSIDIENQHNKPNNTKVIGGVVLLLIGTVFLLQQLNAMFIPGWLISWQTGLIAWGIYIGARCNFRNSGWLIMVLIGCIGLSDEVFPGFDAWSFAWPVAIIIFGAWLIIRRNRHWDEDDWKNKWERKWERRNHRYSNKYGYGSVVEPVTPVNPLNPDNPQPASTEIPPAGSQTSYGPSGDDVLDTVSVFGNVVKTIFSKNFRGGDVVNIFGGTELDLTQADINGRVVIDIVQIFGGSKIIVPSNWQVVSDTAAVFAGIDDKRIKTGVIQDNNKILVLKGVSIFAGIDIRSY